MINYVCFYELWMNYNYCNTVLFYLKLDGIYEERIYNNIDKKKIVRFNPQSFFLGNLKIVENACNTAASNALLASDFLAQPAGRDTRKLGFSIPHTCVPGRLPFPRRKRKQPSIDFCFLPNRRFAFRVLCSLQSRSF